ncbi:ATP-binding protein [Phyllobacterium sophorae]|uniref:Rad50/SbcC-type AAA domain-containing protein n=1 Tax=Phyllobacterium sophorae TaxID=1520277 RepID=A0A2P7BFB8_9HYPH|nr:ATP-binding protein [Phyllobacterium sophorae]PSH65160.1 hypothetical protein CU103_09055 [Phyllobacterium sophorae]
MKNLRFEKLELLSVVEKRARTIEFHPRLTVIKGENDVGKSSVIKSLYWAFGAGSKIHPTWKDAKVKALVTFTVDGHHHFILRDGSRIALFDAAGELMISTTSITSELAPAIGRLFDFKLILTDNNGVAGTPPPAFAFLPFYVDQDNGWGQALESFDNLQQYPKFRKNVIEFHSGIRPNEFYELMAEKRQVSQVRDELGRDRKAIENAIHKLGLEATFTGLELSMADHEASIDQLLVRLRDLRNVRQKRAMELAALLHEREIVREQMEIAKAAAKEFDLDFRWLAQVGDDGILCPTCGTTHRNDFANRFSIVDDSEACAEFVRDCIDRLRAIADQVAAIEAAMRQNDRTSDEISRILAEKRGDVTLEEVIESKGRTSARALLNSQLDEISKELAAYAGQIAAIDDKLKAFEKGTRDRRKLVEKYYAREMLAFLNKLDVRNIEHASVTKIDRKIHDTGSDQPRAVLAYYLALMRTIFEFSKSLTAPMVIDSPNQQDQDASNVAAMIDLIFSSRPDNGQTILGTVSLHDQNVSDGKVIVFEDKNAVLVASEYEEVSNRFRPFFDKMVLGVGPNDLQTRTDPAKLN